MWTFSGVDNITGIDLKNFTEDLISVNTSTGDIRISMSKPVGNYQIKIIGRLPDLTVRSEIFKITIMKKPVYTNFNPIYSFQIDISASNLSYYELPILKNLLDE